MMYESINGGHSHDIVWEDRVPFAEGLVRRNHQTTALVAMYDKLNQYLGLRIGYLNITDVINDDDPVFVQA